MADDRHSSPLLEMKENPGNVNGDKVANGNTDISGNGDTNTVTLKRQVGIVGSCALLVGTIIGSGIFSSPSSVIVFYCSTHCEIICYAVDANTGGDFEP